MDEDIRQHLEFQFNAWKYQRDSGQISQEQFLTEVGNLQIQDEKGIWWTIDPVTERVTYYDDGHWVFEQLSLEQEVQQQPWGLIALVFVLILSLVLCIIFLLGLYYSILVSRILTAVG